MDCNSSHTPLNGLETDMPNVEGSSAFETAQNCPNHAQSKVITYIENTFGEVVDEIQRRPFGHPKITLRRITALKPIYDDSTMNVQWQVLNREAAYHFPGKNKDEAWRFTCVAKILSEIYGGIRSGITITKRDIFYRDPELFRRQATVDRYIDDIAHTCQVTRADLNVTASPKGLFVGMGDCADGIPGGAQMIPGSSNEIKGMHLTHIKWILVVEKEATFKTLVENRLHYNTTIGKGLLVTGKGYPDLATRCFLRAVLDHTCWSEEPPPIFGLFDCDPDGIKILQTYRYGSKALAQEHASNVPDMSWLGLKFEDEFQYMADDKSTLALTPRDRAKAQSMLAGSEWRMDMGEGEGESILEHKYRRALQHMLMLNRKMEIQILEEREGGTATWLEEKLGQALDL